MTQQTLIDLIRHGEPVGGKKYRGQLDDPLSEKGWAQMRSAVEGHAPWDAVVSSSLSRCSEFAKELAEQRGIPVSFDDRLMEIGFGSWEGCTADDIKKNDPQAIMKFWQDPIGNRPKGAETLDGFKQRVVAAFEDALVAHQGKHIIIVGHAGMMRMIITHVLDMPPEAMFRIEVPNAGITRIRVDHHEEGRLMRLVFHAAELL